MRLTDSSYREWALSDWLVHLENRYVDEVKLGLTRVQHVAAEMSLLSPSAIVITVAGTNGKGTTVATLESIYHTAGYRVGTYTSPHLLIFNERIKINGQCIRDDDLCRAFCQIEEARQSIALTYFEMATLAALLYFKSAQVDVIILEVGMGGRLDATNIIDADLLIITTIDFDHQDFLGNTRDEIGFEKAGILRVGKPMIYADHTPPQTVLLNASMLGCPSYIHGQHYHYQLTEKEFIFYYKEVRIQFEKSHWHPNALAAAVMATICLHNQLPLEDHARNQGMRSISLDGRQQRFMTNGVETLLDVSHNAQSVAYLAKTLCESRVKQRVHAVFAALRDKDIDALLQPMMSFVDHWYPVLLSGKRALSAAESDLIFKKYDIINEEFYNSPMDAYQDACKNAVAGDLIVVYGSFLTVNGVLSAFINHLELG